MSFFLGIDGGGTKTRCLVGDQDTQLGAGSSSSCRVQKVGEACARDALSAAIHEACVQAGVSPRQIVRTCAGITGAARTEISSAMRALISSLVGGDIEVVGDPEVAFEDAFGGGPGVLVIAGTGAIAYGRNLAGATARASGWGPAVSDVGSGNWIGVEAVRLALRAHDRDQNSGLLTELIAGLGAKDFEDFIVKVNTTPPPDFSALFPVVLSRAEKGNAIARDILDQAGRQLAISAEVVLTKLFSEKNCPVATHGGIFSNSAIVRNSFAEQLRTEAPESPLLSRDVDPARGALQLARRNFEVAKGG
ncbi:MAG TPA: BadF/BadG/BcrA/BcrD ATPase family protein [Terriglobales bacterium]|nr:BadF/BadG/BcrA/BcrD ATPase family protein [Terriglobales bacterium]